MVGQRKDGQLASVLKWSVPLCIALVLLSIWLLAKGSKGVDISGALALPATGAGMVLSFVIYKLQKPPAEAEESKSGPRDRDDGARSSGGRKLAALTVAAIIGVGGPVVYWRVIHKPDLPVTDLVKITNGLAMTDGVGALVNVPGTPPSRRNLAITFGVDNPADLGDCVQSAHLTLTPVLDGVDGNPVTVIPGIERHFPWPG